MKLFLMLAVTAMLMGVGCASPTNGAAAATPATLDTVAWKATQFRTGVNTQADVSPNNWVYTFRNGTGSLVAAGSPAGNGFTYTLNGTKITIAGASEEHLSNGSWEYWIAGDTMYLNTTNPVTAGDVPMIIFVRN